MVDERREALASLSFANGPVTWDNSVISVTCRVRKYAQADKLGIVNRRDFHLVGSDGTLHEAMRSDDSAVDVPGQVEVLLTLEFTVAGGNDRYELRHRDRLLFYVFARGERDWTVSLIDPDAAPAPGPRAVPLAFQIRAGYAPSVGSVEPRRGYATIDPLAAERCAGATAWCLMVRVGLCRGLTTNAQPVMRVPEPCQSRPRSTGPWRRWSPAVRVILAGG